MQNFNVYSDKQKSMSATTEWFFQWHRALRCHKLQTYSTQWEKWDESFRSAVRQNAKVSEETRLSFKTVSTISTASDSVTCTQPKHHKKRYIKLKNVIIWARSGMTLSHFPNSSLKNVGIGTCAENCYTLQHVSSMKKEETKNIKKKRGTKNEREKEKPTRGRKNRELQKLDLLRTFHLGLNAWAFWYLGVC